MEGLLSPICTTDNVVTLTDSVGGRDGIDTLRNIEKIQFADGVLTIRGNATTENFSSNTTATTNNWVTFGATSSDGSNYGYQTGSVTNGVDTGEAGGTLAREQARLANIVEGTMPARANGTCGPAKCR